MLETFKDWLRTHRQMVPDINTIIIALEGLPDIYYKITDSDD